MTPFKLILLSTTLSVGTLLSTAYAADLPISAAAEECTPPPLGAELYTTYKTALQSGDSNSMRQIEHNRFNSTSPLWVSHQFVNDSPPTQSCPLWAALSDVMRKAYNTGDTKTLEVVKALHPRGFGNLDDLGEPFFKYGAGLGNWGQMIADATFNATQQTAE